MASGSGSSSSSNEQQHRSSQVARAHPLYPLLKNIAQSIKQSHKAIEVVDARTRKMERDYAAINVQLQELLSAIKEQNKRQFNLKSAGFEVLIIVHFIIIYHIYYSRVILGMKLLTACVTLSQGM